jgi:NAD(P)-dependent dehydrogenase (short-subunit alcohol dehydrogenase family)
VRDGVAAAETELGAITILVNNSGVADAGASFLEQDEADWDRVIDTNLKGAWLVAREVAGHMVRLGHGGRIVNVGSVLAFRAAARVPAYAASKAGLIQLTRAMAVELARHDIRVNALAPGYVETDLNRDFLNSPAGEAIAKRIPQRRFGRMEDLDGPLLLLASDASAYMTGAVITIDGGQSVAL